MLNVSEGQFKALEAACDVIVASFSEKNNPEYWASKASDLDVASEILSVVGSLTAEEQKEFLQLLDLLEKRLTGLIWAGKWAKFRDLPFEKQEKVLQKWLGSHLNLLRKAFQSIKRLSTFLHYGSSDDDTNPSWKALGYPGPLDVEPGPLPDIRPLTPQIDMTLDCDVVVVGSGAGGGLIAGMLAEAGHQVLVVEKGPFVSGKGWNQRETEMIRKSYDQQGAFVTKDGGVTIFAGSCLGGGTTVNWTGSFPTPDYVLEEWSANHGFSAANTSEYAAGLQSAMDSISANTDNSPHNPQNEALWRGSEALGHKVGVIHRNVEGCREADNGRACGYCGMGCRRGNKRGTLRTWLQRAADKEAQFLVDTTVTRVLKKGNQATGIEATTKNAAGQPITLTIRAKRVVVAAGAVQTPALLLRSGLSHPQLGRNLFFHPTLAVTGIYDEEIDPWYGVMMSAVNKEGIRTNGNYGYWMETPPLHTGVAALASPWASARQHKEDLLKVKNMASFIVLTRDKFGGRVTVDKQGQARVAYQLHAEDRGVMLQGIKAAWEIHRAAGSTEVVFPHSKLKKLDPSVSKAEANRFISGMPNWGWKANQFNLFTAHQMGTCAIGGNAARHPVDPTGAWRGMKGLYIADGSLMPTCAGINPMVSIMGLAHWIGQGLK